MRRSWGNLVLVFVCGIMVGSSIMHHLNVDHMLAQEREIAETKAQIEVTRHRTLLLIWREDIQNQNKQ